MSDKILKIKGPLPLPPSESGTRPMTILLVENTGQLKLNFVKSIEV